MLKKNERIEKGKQFWFDAEKEIRIYKYLNASLKKREIRKLKDSERFTRYSQWEGYVISRYRNASKEQLTEFYKYLKYCERTIIGIDNGWNGFVMPFIVALFSSLAIEFFKSVGGIPINFETLINPILDTNTQWFVKMILFAALLIMLVLYLSPIIIVIGFFSYVMVGIIKTSVESEGEKTFYEDYIALIEDMIDTADTTN